MIACLIINPIISKSKIKRPIKGVRPKNIADIWDYVISQNELLRPAAITIC